MLNKLSSKAKEAVKNAKVRVKEEVGELTQHTSKQLSGGTGEVHPRENPKQEISPIAEAMQQTSQPTVSDEERKKITLQFIDRKKILEEEIEKYKKVRDDENKSRWEEGRNSSNLVNPGEPIIKPLEIPKSKPAMGKMAGAPGTAKGETGPEVRKSKQ